MWDAAISTWFFFLDKKYLNYGYLLELFLTFGSNIDKLTKPYWDVTEKLIHIGFLFSTTTDRQSCVIILSDHEI
jgi:hypothetical protein